MRAFKKQLPHITVIFQIYLIGILIFTLFRFLLFITSYSWVQEIPQTERVSIFFKAFFMGFRFDTVISGYILALPLLLLTAQSFVKKTIPKLNHIIFWYCTLLFSISFLFCAIDIPFFSNFNTRLNMTMMAWQNTPGFVLRMVFQDLEYSWTLLPLAIVITLFVIACKRILLGTKHKPARHLNNIAPGNYLIRTILTLVIFFCLFAGIRGRLVIKSPIRVGTAYFCNYGFPNMLGLNPVFSLMRSYLDSRNHENDDVHFMDGKVAIQNIQKWYNIKADTLYNSPIARVVQSSPATIKPNVVLIVMESMSVQKLSYFGNTGNIAPFMDSLVTKSYLFTNMYSSGIHTRFGIFSTLFSYPCYMRKHPMKIVDMQKYSGIGSVMRQNGYSTIYFTTHDDQFDNIGGFLRANDYTQLISQKNYPKEKVRSSLGVPDDYMFEFSMPYLNQLASKKEPFFVTFLTASDHGPRIIPEYFTPRSKEIERQSVEFADWSLQKFMHLAKQQKWYDNTIFVFVADHGIKIASSYDLPVERFHIPLLFFSPKYIKQPKIFDQLASQLDVFPTIMGFLHLPYVNNTLGIDLFSQKRPYAVFTSDDKFGVIDKENLLIERENKITTLHDYAHNQNADIFKLKEKKANEMKSFGESMIQATQWMIESHLMNPTKKQALH